MKPIIVRPNPVRDICSSIPQSGYVDISDNPDPLTALHSFQNPVGVANIPPDFDAETTVVDSFPVEDIFDGLRARSVIESAKDESENND